MDLNFVAYADFGLKTIVLSQSPKCDLRYRSPLLDLIVEKVGEVGGVSLC